MGPMGHHSDIVRLGMHLQMVAEVGKFLFLNVFDIVQHGFG